MRLIDADALRQDWLENGQNEYVYDTNAVLYSIDEAPPIDAVPVVRCKDCRMFVDNKKALVTYCRRRLANITVRLDDFCSYGERRADNG